MCSGLGFQRLHACDAICQAAQTTNGETKTMTQGRFAPVVRMGLGLKVWKSAAPTASANLTPMTAANVRWLMGVLKSK